jgi:hypothetical protein
MAKILIIFGFIKKNSIFSNKFINGYAQRSKAKWCFNLSGGIGYDVASATDNEKDLIDMGFTT